jgi:hypothetical protein
MRNTFYVELVLLYSVILEITRNVYISFIARTAR